MHKGVSCTTFMIKSETPNTIIEGYASIFNINDSDNDIIAPGAFKSSLNSSVKLLWQHDHTKPIGIITKMQEDATGLRIEAEINNKTTDGMNASALLRQRAVTGLSIGFNILESDYNQKSQRVISALDLKEISIVTFPANDMANVEEVKSLNNKQQNKEEKMNNVEKMINQMQNTDENNNLVKAEINKFIRTGEIDSLNTKSFSSHPDEAGAVVNNELSKKIIDAVYAQSVMRRIASVERISSKSLDIILEDGNFDAGWVAETAARNVTDTPKLSKKTITAHELYAQPKATRALISDAEIDIQQWLIARIADSFANMEDQAFFTGDGNNKPSGLLSNNYIKKIDGADKVTVEPMLEAINDIAEQYRSNLCFVMNRNTLSAIQGLRDDTGRFIWQHSLSDPMTQTIFGVPVYVSSFMPDVGTDNLSIAVGNFKSAYKIVDRSDIGIMYDPYTDKPFIRYYAVKRVGGDVVDINAVRLIKFA